VLESTSAGGKRPMFAPNQPAPEPTRFGPLTSESGVNNRVLCPRNSPMSPEFPLADLWSATARNPGGSPERVQRHQFPQGSTPPSESALMR